MCKETEETGQEQPIASPIDLGLWREAVNVVGLNACFGRASKASDIYEDLLFLERQINTPST